MGATTADGNNHLAGFSYDPSGNTLADGNYTYTWNGESQLLTAGGVTYNYDGDGRRAAKAGNKLYWYGSGGQILAETDASGNVLNEYVYFGGRRVAVLPSSGSVLYYAEDFLGSSRVMVQSDGTLCYDADFTPFGGERYYQSSCAQNYKFEGKERDAETGNDDFGAREYSWRFGRWLSSDWSATPVAVPYANLSNPQTLNLYSMVSDDPESFADLDGHINTPGAEQATACQTDPNGKCQATQNQNNNDQKSTQGQKTTYKSKKAAAKAAGREMRKKENGYKWEYGARIHKDGKTYTYGPVVTNKKPGGVDLPAPQKDDVGDIHTHNYGVDDPHANSIEYPDEAQSARDKTPFRR